MKTQVKPFILASLIGALFTPDIHAQISASTYPGRLTESNVLATGLGDVSDTSNFGSGGIDDGHRRLEISLDPSPIEMEDQQ